MQVTERYIILKGARMAHVYTGADTLCAAARTRAQLAGAEILEKLPPRQRVCQLCLAVRENYEVSNGDGERKEKRESLRRLRKKKAIKEDAWGEWLF